MTNDRLAALYHDHITDISARTDRAMSETGFDHLVIAAGALHVAFLDDHTYPFKANPHFKWWVPIVDNPNCYIIYTPGSKPKLLYYQPVDYWYKPAETPSGFWIDEFEIHIIRDENDAQHFFPTHGNVATIAEGSSLSDPLVNRLHWERAWKTEYEIECMRRANRRAARAHRAAEEAFRAGKSEYDIHLTYLRAADSTE